MLEKNGRNKQRMRRKNGIRNVEVKKILQISRCQTSADALIRAVEVEAAYNTSRTCHSQSGRIRDGSKRQGRKAA